MTTELTLPFRVKVATLEPGHILNLKLSKLTYEQAKRSAKLLAAARRWTLDISKTEDGIRLERLPDPPHRGTGRWRLGGMEVGEHRDFDMPIADQMLLRQAAAAHARRCGWILSVNRVPGTAQTLRVTRRPDGYSRTFKPDESLQVERELGAWPLAALEAVGAWFWVPITEKQVPAMFSSTVAYHAKKLGRKFSIRYSGDDRPPLERGYYVVRTA